MREGRPQFESGTIRHRPQLKGLVGTHAACGREMGSNAEGSVVTFGNLVAYVITTVSQEEAGVHGEAGRNTHL